MGNRVTYRRERRRINWRRVQDAAFSVTYWIIVGLLIIAIGVWINGMIEDQKGNAIENSNQWAGYSEVGVHQIFDRKTGVLYAVTDAGYICVMVDEDGNPRRVD